MNIFNEKKHTELSTFRAELWYSALAQLFRLMHKNDICAIMAQNIHVSWKPNVHFFNIMLSLLFLIVMVGNIFVHLQLYLGYRELKILIQFLERVHHINCRYFN